jgi:hypothetical protein
MGQVSLEDALALVVLYAEQGEPRFERAAVRWLGRLLLEKPMPLALAARCVELIAELRGPTQNQRRRRSRHSAETDTFRLRSSRSDRR